MSVFSGAFSYLQKIGKCMMLPVSVLPVAGILLGVGSANFPWLPQSVSQVMAQSGGAIFSNLPLLFAIGVAIGLTDNDGVAALASTVGFAVFPRHDGRQCETARDRNGDQHGNSHHRYRRLWRHHSGPHCGLGL
jgi:phosphotransferase system  glucose/maltose/N-acetylglucosamine-specific IIC component